MGSIRLFCTVMSIILGAGPASAEYRAFLLRIEKMDRPGEVRELISTLDPLQYPGYFPLQENERVSYVRTWMCKGRTNLRPICPDPESEKTEASEEETPPADPATEPSTAPIDPRAPAGVRP